MISFLLAAAIVTAEAEPLKLSAPAVQCKRQGGNFDAEGYAFPRDFGGTKSDACVKLESVENGYDVSVAPVATGPYRKTGRVELNSRRTTVDKTWSTSLGSFVPDEKKAKPYNLLLEVSVNGVMIVKVYPDAGIDVAFWAPKVSVEGTFKKK